LKTPYEVAADSIIYFIHVLVSLSSLIIFKGCDSNVFYL